ncbi:MAG: amino acid permease [Phycisphaerales bacterium]|nr:amino acid permease [Phycisphaerales bacterium]
MANDPQPKRLKRELGLFDVYAIATGATLSAGFFLLPGLAAEEVGPAIVLCYMLAVVPLIPAMLCIVELSTAMPRAGGAYYFLDRSLGPMVGTVGGFGTWLALTLKATFALVGMGAYIELFAADVPSEWFVKLIGITLALLFGLVNFLGAKKSGGFQIVLVAVLLVLLAGFIGHGTLKADITRFQGFFDKGGHAIISTAGMVYISYVGVTNVASISGEVRNPERNLPWGVFLALGTAILIYALGTFIMVSVVPANELAGIDGQPDLTLVATAARHIAPSYGVIIVSVAALLAFASVANAAILGSSRYPLAMSRDHLLPTQLRRLGKRGTPGYSILLSVAAIIAFLLFLDPITIAKLASAFQLLIFAILCVSVIVMRESKIESYDPGYKAPFYPWLQIFGCIAPLVLITQMGWLATVFTSAVIAAGVAWYFFYARTRVERHGAIYHVFERLGHRRFDALDTELRGILKEKGLRADDPFDEVIAHADVMERDGPILFEDIVRDASIMLAERLPCSADVLAEGFLQGTRIGATPVSGGVALPHLRLPGIDVPHMLLLRSLGGVQIVTGDVFGDMHREHDAYAVFFLVSPERDPSQHLRLLAQLAGRVDQEGFTEQWRAARDENELRETLLRNERFISLHLLHPARAAKLIGRAIRSLDIPVSCLVVLISREGHSLIPRGDVILQPGDRVTIIGDADGIRELYATYGPEPAAPDGDEHKGEQTPPANPA